MEIFMLNLDFDKIENVLVDCLLDDLSSQELLTRFSIALMEQDIKSALLYIDTNFRIISHVFHESFNVEVWKNLASRGYVPEETVLAGDYLKTLDEIGIEVGSRLSYTANDTSLPTAFAGVFENSRLSAYFCVMLKDVCDEDALKFCDLLSLSLSEFDTDKKVVQSLGEAILLARDVNEKNIAAFMGYCKPPYYLALLSTESLGFSSAEYVRGLFNADGFSVFSVTENTSDILILFSKSDYDIVVDKLDKIAKSYEYSIALSDCFSDLLNIKIPKRQALLCLNTAKKLGICDKVSSFAQMYLFIICDLSLASDMAETMTFNKYKFLLEKDAKLAETLKSYLINFGKTSAVSKDLSLHKNSVAYRISKIESMLGLELSDTKTSLELAISIAIEDFRPYIEVKNND